MPGAELWILGAGPERDALADRAKRLGLASKVSVVGQVPSTEIPAWLERCDVGILPIRRDVFLDFAFPNKLPEYIITGKAVIVSQLKAIQHYFSPDALAYFKPNDRQDLARQMVRLYQNPALRTRLATRAKEEYAPRRWAVMKRRYLTLIEGITDSGRHAAERSRASESTVLAR